MAGGFPSCFLSFPQELGEGCLLGSGKIINIKTNFSKLPAGSYSTICRRRSNAGSFWKVRPWVSDMVSFLLFRFFVKPACLWPSCGLPVAFLWPSCLPVAFLPACGLP
ncbi:hypothetical protein, partial [Thiolapillus sp.]|uniref:hypothetical protein n=1 Tax=Thiolapillus sp. TaxID=2017437 RepID=UPI003AF60DCD